MVQFVLIRPGSTEFDEQGRIQGTLDIPLSEQGQREVQEAIAGLSGLGISVIYAFPTQATWQTASTIAEAFAIKVKKLDALQNVDQGLWQGMLIEEVKRKNPKVFRQLQEHPEMVCPPEGETLSDARERAEAALEKLRKKHKEGVVGIVVAEPLASLVHCLCHKSEMTEVWKAKPPGLEWELIGSNPVICHRGCEMQSPQNGENPGSIPTPIPLESSR